jgi:hypothetical protein
LRAKEGTLEKERKKNRGQETNQLKKIKLGMENTRKIKNRKLVFVLGGILRIWNIWHPTKKALNGT